MHIELTFRILARIKVVKLTQSTLNEDDFIGGPHRPGCTKPETDFLDVLARRHPALWKLPLSYVRAAHPESSRFGPVRLGQVGPPDPPLSESAL